MVLIEHEMLGAEEFKSSAIAVLLFSFRVITVYIRKLQK